MKEEEKKENQEVQGPGGILRGEREKRGLTYQDMAETTRLRPSIIKAIENQAWDSLPSPAFARGFMKTYAKALSMDSTMILEAYGRKPNPDGELHRVPPEPLRSRRKGPFFLLCIFAAAVVFALWKAYAPPEGALTVSVAKPPAVAVVEPEKDVAVVASEPPSVQKSTEEKDAIQSFVSSSETEQSAADEIPAIEPAAVTTAETVPAPGPHMLKGKVNARTWVKIYVDDLNPREYMFQPGQQPEWTASKGFYLIIGNAGGIDLEWNGRGVTTLGNAGQVVRLSLPEDFRHRVEGN